ncbi:MAG: DNA-processing protein DprA [Candidatus Daviesbacteria bacterium]|nr:DNA-processing protein DprA [Candidatus Daviesbacteria bacterium]
MVNQYLLALHSVNGLGPIRLKELLNRFRDPKIAWEASFAELVEVGLPTKVVSNLIETRKTLDPQEYLDSIIKSGIKILTIFDEDYPKLLKQIYDPPVVLYYKGEVDWNKKAIAVVGTRKITGYGRSVTEQFVKDLAFAGLTIVSGLARGVDTVAHKSAIEAGGQTIAVLGGGLNEIYPPENRQLAREIIDGHGVIMSEFAPDEPSVPGNFPARNRIIAGLSLGVLVTEAAYDSGSLITAREAIEQGKEVFAIPGPITSDLSKGPVSLIQDGAKPVFDAVDILEELGVNSSQGKSQVATENMTDEEKAILELLENEQLHIDNICRSLNLSAAQVSGTLLKMEIIGLIKNLGAGVYAAA